MSWRLLTGIVAGRGGGVIGTPTFRAVASTAIGVRSTLTVSKPTGTTDNDLLVAFVPVATTDTITAPSGWTLIRDTLFNASGSHVSSYYKVASSEPASWDWTIGASVTCMGVVAAYSQCATSSPLINSTSNPNQAGVTNDVALSITTSTPNALLVGIYVCSGNRTYTPPGDMTERFDQGNGPSQELTDSVQAAAGASGNKTAVISSAAAACAQLLAFKALGT